MTAPEVVIKIDGVLYPLPGMEARGPAFKAGDLSEPAILAVLQKRPGEAHTHWTGAGSMPRVLDPSHRDTPPKVLLAKLRAMARKGLIDGCGCGCRGDWRWPPTSSATSPPPVAARR